MKVTVSAPGKIHLLGEHAVVYGKPALLTAIDRRLYVTVSQAVNDSDRLIEVRSDDGRVVVDRILKIFQKAYPEIKLSHLNITVTSQIPEGCGMGSSAALAVATFGALLKFAVNIWNPVRINELAYEAEKLQHGNPSGGDNTVTAFGGLLWYRKEFEFLKSIWSLPMTSYRIPKFIMINSGKPLESTGEMVAKVRENYSKNKKTVTGLFDSQEEQTKNLLLSFRNGNLEETKNAIKRGERNLEKLGVVGSLAKSIIFDIEKLGGTAKISGAGGVRKGSGLILCYHPDFNKILAVGKKHKLGTFSVIIGSEGVRMEK